MKHTALLLFAASLLLLAAGCSLTEPDETYVRLHNAGSVGFDAVEASPFGTAGTLAPGATTAYRTTDTPVYRLAYVRIEAEGKTFVLQPIDYVGETPLGPGRYTYELTLDAADLDREGEPVWNGIELRVRTDR